MPTLLETVLSNALVASLLALLAFAVSRLRRPALAHALWLLVLLKLLTPPIVPVYLPRFAAETPAEPANDSAQVSTLASLDALAPAELAALIEEVASAPEATETPSSRSDPQVGTAAPAWQDWVMPIWLGGSALVFAGALWSIGRFRCLMRSARRAPAALQNQARQLAAQLGLPRCPQVWLVPGAVSPMIWALGTAPRLLFPLRLLNRLDAQQRAALLLHELAHVRRRDHWVRLVELLVAGLYWWHPVVWWARRELREAEEQCCDAWVVWASGGEGQPYALALLQTVAFVSQTRFPLPATASGIGHVSHLRRRLTMIMRGNTPRSLSALGWIVVLGVGLFLLPLAAQAQVPAKQGGDDRDREIKALKDKLMALEEEQQIARYQARLVAAQALGAVAAQQDKVSAEVEQAMKTAAELKKMIAAKRAELNDLERKLQRTLAILDGHKAGKTKAKEVKEKPKDPEVKALNEKAAKQLGEAIKAEIEIELKGLDDLKKLGNLKELDLKKLDDLKQHGIVIELKSLDELKNADAKAQRDKLYRIYAEKLDKAKVRKTEDIETRLDRLMKELEQLRREIRENKEIKK